jgi:hypothetical protein
MVGNSLSRPNCIPLDEESDTADFGFAVAAGATGALPVDADLVAEDDAPHAISGLVTTDGGGVYKQDLCGFLSREPTHDLLTPIQN